MNVGFPLRRFVLPLAVVVSAVSCARDATTRTPLLPTAPSASAVPDTTQLHVYVHYDYLVFSGPNAHSDAPDPAAIQRVVDAFAAHNIDLVIDPKHTAIPGKTVMSMSGSVDAGIYLCDQLSGQYDAVSLQAQYFHPTSNHDWHYAVFGDAIDATGARCRPDETTGIAQLPGNSFMVAMQTVQYFNYTVESTFMHELGHNLGLHHGGNEENNWKPNYLSVMNYLFLHRGIPYGASLGSTTIVGYRLDYSSVALPTLDESHLNETLGIQAGTTDITMFNTRLPPFLLPRGARAPASGPIDWNLDGTATETDVAADLNYWVDCHCFVSTFEKMTGFDDWTAVRGYLAGTIVPGPKTIVHETSESEPTVTAISPASGPATGGTTVTITGTHLDDATQVFFGGGPFDPTFGPLGLRPAKFTIVDDKTIIATAPPADTTAGYITDVTVVSGMNASPNVAADQFTYTSVLPAITSVSPSTGPFGTQITVHGSYFTGMQGVSLWGSVSGCNDCFYPQISVGFTLVDDHTVVVNSSNNFQPAVLGAYHIVMFSAAGSNYPRLGPNDVFVFTPKQPSLFSVTPGYGPEAGGTPVSLVGEDFLGATAVTFGSVNAPSFTVADDNHITAQAPPGTGTVDITVTGPDGTSALRTADRFSYLPRPTVNSVSPSSGPMAGGTAITIHGSGFAAPAGAAVSVQLWQNAANGVGVASYVVVNDTTITAVTNPAPGAGAYHVTVTNPGGMSAWGPSDQFTYF